MSQSPQTGQFNSYPLFRYQRGDIFLGVSIPSNGSIQFLQEKWATQLHYLTVNCLNPLKRVNSILTKSMVESLTGTKSQCLNPLKRVNSILTLHFPHKVQRGDWSGSQSPQTGQFNSYCFSKVCGRWTRRWVSIPSNGSIQFLRNLDRKVSPSLLKKSQSPQTGQFNSYLFSQASKPSNDSVSIPSNGSIQFLRKTRWLQKVGKLVSIPSNGSIQFLREVMEAI